MDRNDLDAWLLQMPGADHPFPTSPARLYAPADLYQDFDPVRPTTLKDSFDARVTSWLNGGGPVPRKLSIGETIAARLHDTAIDRLVAGFVLERKPSVGMMGSHSISRADPAFLQFAVIARALQREGHLVITGGGPGLMEAANFGAFLGPCVDEVLDEALEILKQAPVVADAGAWVKTAAEARALVLQHMPGAGAGSSWNAPAPDGALSLGLPTWYYDTEPPNLFASHIGKYFFNSLREDGLVNVSTAGIVFGMGEAGTVQEIFQSASLNYYRPEGHAPTPMVFVGSDYWSPAQERRSAVTRVSEMRKPAAPLVEAMAWQASAPFDGAVHVCDGASEVIDAIARSAAGRSSCIAETRLSAAQR
jgi:predicted Rossmann-fold nucleotide-binding protein